MIPNIIHFIFGLDERFGGKPFSFIHFLAVYSAWKVNRPSQILFHYHYEPDTLWWTEAKKYVSLNRVDIPSQIFGNAITHFAHKADVIRLQQLQKYGGVYLDLDVLCLNAFAPLLQHEMVMGSQAGTGLCNAVILANPMSEFLAAWLDTYRDFDKDSWSRHSVEIPFELYEQRPDWIHVEGPYSFFYPLFNEPAGANLWGQPVPLKHRAMWMAKRIADHLVKPRKFRAPLGYVAHTLRPASWHQRVLSRSYCVHLWEQLWWAPYLKDITAAHILEGKNVFSRVFRDVIGETDLQRFAALGRLNPPDFSGGSIC